MLTFLCGVYSKNEMKTISLHHVMLYKKGKSKYKDMLYFFSYWYRGKIYEIADIVNGILGGLVSVTGMLITLQCTKWK